MSLPDPFGARDTLSTAAGSTSIYRLEALEKKGLTTLSRLPYSIRILLESILRHAGRGLVKEEDVASLATWSPKQRPEKEVPFMVGRVLMQDFTGVPAVVDLAAMRGAMKKLGGNPNQINPLIPTDLVIDHSVQVDHFGSPDALERNEKIEFERNLERYEFLRWGQEAFDNFRVIPPSTGIVHQVNVEYIASVVATRKETDGSIAAYPDSLIGTDSHTTMANGLGVLGWGVGGIEAEASMLGQPYYMLAPEVVGMRLEGELPTGIMATDLVLMVTELLRAHGVVGKFVEFYGPGVKALSLGDRATLANMAPEYGATMGFFPADEKTLDYLTLTGREKAHIELVEKYLKEQGLFLTGDAPDPEYSSSLSLDMSQVVPSLAGPKRPQDRVPMKDMKSAFEKNLSAPVAQRGFALSGEALKAKAKIADDSTELTHGAVVIAAITSCTNTSNPFVMVGAGLVAKKAVEKGLLTKSYVKTSLAPGSRVVTDYLEAAGLMPFLEQLGFHVVGYGCTTCIGNSGPLPEKVGDAIKAGDLVAASVLSGNRNFEGRVNPLVKANYLASPPLVVAYALAGRVDVDMDTTPLGTGKDGAPVFLKDIWPTTEEINETIAKAITPEMFRARYSDVSGNEAWKKIPVTDSELYPWDKQSTYIQEPPFFDGLKMEVAPLKNHAGMRVLALLGDSVTTDHISPASTIQPESAAGKYLLGLDVSQNQFNSFGSRRGNDRVMTRGTFGNIRLKNNLLDNVEGSFTLHNPSGEKMSIYEAAQKYAEEKVPLLVIGGKEYGTGSSRDWAAKGTLLLGVKAVLAESFERIHRSNLVGMGVLPLVFKDGENASSLGLTGKETYELEGISDDMGVSSDVTVRATAEGGSTTTFTVQSRIDTGVELDYYRNGGILQTVLRQLLTN